MVEFLNKIDLSKLKFLTEMDVTYPPQIFLLLFTCIVIKAIPIYAFDFKTFKLEMYRFVENV